MNQRAAERSSGARYGPSVSSGGSQPSGDRDDNHPLVVAPRVEHLPLGELEWERYERLLRRLAREERGLRRVRLYGSRGQSQYGIDLVGQASDGTGEAIQAKRYTTFKPADLTAAVKKFLKHRHEIPFNVERLFVAAACDVDRRQITDELYRLTTAHPDLEIEFWDRRSQCDMLRRRRDIVAEFFGDQAVDVFCYPAPSSVVPAVAPDRVRIADALMGGPAQVTGATAALARADRLQVDAPDGAATAVQEAIQLLRDGGFAAHAAVLVPRRADLLARAGAHDDAVRLLSDEFWRAVDSQYEDDAASIARAMSAHEPSPTVKPLVAIVEHALLVLHHPVGRPAVGCEALDGDAVVVELARLMLLMAQATTVDPTCTWVAEHAEQMSALADRLDRTSRDRGTTDRGVVVALRCEIADATGDWTDLLTAARRHRLARSDAALVLARYALHLAERGDHDEADQAWADATEQGCLAGEDARAASWVHARRILSSRFQGITRSR